MAWVRLVYFLACLRLTDFFAWLILMYFFGLVQTYVFLGLDSADRVEQDVQTAGEDALVLGGACHGVGLPRGGDAIGKQQPYRTTNQMSEPYGLTNQMSELPVVFCKLSQLSP